MAAGRSPQDDDGTLLERIAQSDVDAFAMLYDRYGGPVYSLACGMLRDIQAAQEVTQDVFLGIWRGAARAFDAGRGNPRSWILSLAHHKSVDVVRRRRRQAVSQLDESMPDDVDIVADAIRKLEGERVQQALGDLSVEQRTVLVLAYYGGYTQREIADRTGAPLGTVKTRMRDGLLRLRAALDADRRASLP